MRPEAVKALPTAFEIRLGAGEAGSAFRARGIERLSEAMRLVESLPYGRNASAAPLAVLVEARGTCRSKHVLLKLAAEEAGFASLRLVLGFYEMGEETNPGLGPVLARHGLGRVLEAHCFLRFEASDYDFTGLAPGRAPVILEAQEVSVAFVHARKTALHREKSRAWALAHGLDPERVWAAREAYIAALGE